MRYEEYSVSDLIGPLNEVERKNAPGKLYVAGDVHLFSEGSRVSVVGSRKVTAAGGIRARDIATKLVERGMVVVSGLAAGVDTLAHRTTIECGGRTIAVLGTPLDKAYPSENRVLLDEISSEHLAVSQFPTGYPARPRNWPMRNRTMALLSDATIIVEASEKSGTRHQGWEALRLGRLLFLLESVAKDRRLSWPSEMIRYGAQVLTRDSLQLVLDEMPVRANVDQLTF